MIKKILSIAAAGVLILLYVSTLVFGLIQSPMTKNLLIASIVATIIIPVLIYSMQFAYRILKDLTKK